jgi:predicted P-loop ATPase
MSDKKNKSTSEKGNKKPVFKMAEEYLNKNYEFKNNIVANEIEYRKFPTKDFSELCENSVYRDLKLKGISIPFTDLKAILGSDFVPKYDPFREYFKNLPSWSNEDCDHILKLASYVKAKDQERFNRHLRKALVRMVACALSEKFFNKQALILIDANTINNKSGQNIGKTSFCRFLCPPALKNYFTENPSVDKDGMISLAENFIINLDELALMGKSEINLLKSFISKDKIKVRPPFGRKTKTMPRRANFVGSSNNNEFLADETGSVRWINFEVESINWNYKQEVDIDLVWSQAYNLYLSGFEYNLSSEEIHENELINKQYFITTMEIDSIQKYYEPCDENDPAAIFMTASDLIDDLREKTGRSLSFKPNIMGKALKHLGFVKGQKKRGKYPVKGYFLKEINDGTPTKKNKSDINVPF